MSKFIARFSKDMFNKMYLNDEIDLQKEYDSAFDRYFEYCITQIKEILKDEFDEYEYSIDNKINELMRYMIEKDFENQHDRVNYIFQISSKIDQASIIKPFFKWFSTTDSK